MPEYLFTWAVFNSTLIWALALHFADLLNNQIGNYFQRFLIILTLHVVLFGLLFLLKKLVFDNLQPQRVPVVLFVAISTLGVLRGVVLQYLLIRYNSATDSSYALRMWASFLNTASSFVIATITLGNIRAQYSTRSRLLTEKNRLEYVQKSAQESLASVNSDVVHEIKKDLLAKVKQMYGTATSTILVQIRNTIDEVVRPLSRSLDEKIQPWTPPSFEISKLRISWKTAFKESIKSTQINYIAVPIMMSIVAVPTILQRSPFYVPLIFLPLIALTGTAWGYWIHKNIAPRFNSPIAYFVLTTINGAVMGSLTLFFTQDYKEPFGLLLLAIIFFPSSSLIISFLTTASRIDSETNQQLEEVTKNLAWNVARVREQHFQMQKSLASTLHGEVQAKLASTYLQLETLANAGQDSQEKVTALIQDLERTVEKINSPESGVNDLAATLERVKSNWRQVADIQIDVLPETLKEIQKDPVCTATLTEIIPELCFNGVKHGEAKEISINLHFSSARVIELKVTNNGSFNEIAAQDGLGTKFLNEASIQWKRELENGLTVTRAEFAYSAN